jgi:hypothetical protein
MALALIQDHQQIIIGVNQEYLEEWIGHREDIGKPMTERAIRMLTKKLLRWSEEDQERCVSESIENGWKGVHWVEPPKAQSTRSTTLEQDLMDRSWAK